MNYGLASFVGTPSELLFYLSGLVGRYVNMSGIPNTPGHSQSVQEAIEELGGFQASYSLRRNEILVYDGECNQLFSIDTLSHNVSFDTLLCDAALYEWVLGEYQEEILDMLLYNLHV